MYKIITYLMVALMMVTSSLFFALLIDMEDGRKQHLIMSPYFKANTDGNAITLALIMFAAALFIMGTLIVNYKTDKKLRRAHV